MRERGDGRSRLQGATEKVVMVVVMVVVVVVKATLEKGCSRQIAAGTNKSVSSRQTRRGEFRVNCFPASSLLRPVPSRANSSDTRSLEKRLLVPSNRRLKF